ncbi:MAG: ERAP1-like C-terminal domain-containing protein [Anaerolineae bacterium]|nr:ERAP1-like C-terminal domain-containing protein [Anaerolineae bacterium]
MHPIHYDLYLEPDLQTFTCPGRVTIAIETETPTGTVVLNANDLDVAECTLKRGNTNVPCAFDLTPEAQTLTVTLPSPQTGAFKLTLTFTAKINELLVGLYRSRYRYEDQDKYLAVTQFEEREARRVFPCFDEPAKKATFDVSFLIDANLTGIANTVVVSETPQPNGKKLLRFARTPRMCTYLLFFGVGDFEIIDDGQTDPRVRLITPPGKTQYGKFALDWGRKSLEFGNAYTGIPFPLAQCDYIAVPDFAFGAMENYGAITFRENLLLVYPGVTSQQQQVQIAKVIAHETAHMWFGNLVSPDQWKYIWLNESFATYFNYVIPNHYCPDWHLWDEFYTDTVLPGMERDELQNTVPIELPGGEEVNIDASSAPIIYNKGAAIIRMLATYLGETLLKQGLTHFLDRHQFACANSVQYWQAFEEATGAPVGDFAASWVYQPGYPLVSARRDGKTLHLSQERFIVSGKRSDQHWIIPLEIALYFADGREKKLNHTLNATEETLELPAGVEAYKLNAGQCGFYRVRYPAENLAALGRRIAEQKLSPADSCGVANDLFALVKRGDCSVLEYLEFVKTAFANEDRYLPLNDLAGNMLFLHLIAAEQRERVAAIGREIFEKVLLKMGLTPQPDDDLQTATLRDTLLWSAFTFGSEEAAAFGEEQFKSALEGKTIPADILRSVFRIGAITRGDAADTYFRATLNEDHAPEIKKMTALIAMGRLTDLDKLRAALDMNFSEVPPKNRLYLVSAIAANPIATDFLWDWIKDHPNELQTLHPSHFGNVIGSCIPICGRDRQAAAQAYLDEIAAAYPNQRPVTAMTGEMLEVYARLGKS